MDAIDKIPLPEKLSLESDFKATIIDVIRGGLGLVYIFNNGENVHPRIIAAKTFNPRKVERFGKEKALEILSREAKQWFSYGRHPLILRPLHVKVVSGWPYIVMPYRANTLRAFINSESDPACALSFAIEICHGLGYARSCGLTAHQDLKPENILIRDLAGDFDLPEEPVLDQYAQVADFGLANAYEEIGRKDGENPYMAAEQFASGDTDFSKVDVFALGVIFTEMFSGNHPTGRHADDIGEDEWKDHNRWHYWATEDKKLDSSIAFEPPEIRGVVEDMLRTDSAKRPSLEEVKKRLSTILSKVDSTVLEQTLMWTGRFDKMTRDMESQFISEERQFAERQLEKINSASTRVPGT